MSIPEGALVCTETLTILHAAVMSGTMCVHLHTLVASGCGYVYLCEGQLLFYAKQYLRDAYVDKAVLLCC